MKRHPSLIPLSWEHHDALVLAQGLILGRSNAPRSNWPTDRRLQIDRVNEFFQETFFVHFDVEEMYLFARVTERMPDQAELIDELRRDHDVLRGLVSELSAGCLNGLDVRLPALGRVMKAHIRKEERVLFQAVQSGLDPTELEVIGTDITTHLTGQRNCSLVEPRRSDSFST